MNKTRALASILALTLSLFALSEIHSQVKTERPAKTDDTARTQNGGLADTIKRLTNRSSEGLVQRSGKNGGVSVDLDGRFQHVALSRIRSDGEEAKGCVSSIEEANAFFETDLETGVPLPNYVFLDPLAETAERHGMSAREFLFYSRLIEEANARRSAVPEAATITIVNNDGAGEGFNDPTPAAPEGGNNGATLGAQRLNLFNFAAGIWGAFLDTNVTIQVRSQFDPLTCTPTSAVLGSAGTTTVHRDFANAGFPGTWYHQALANKQSGSDRSANPDMNATFNSNLVGNPGCLGGRRFYLGFDNSTPAGTTNLLIVLLHEMGHGFGFSTFVNGTSGALFLGFPDVYSRFIYDRTTSKYWNAMTDAERMASAINPNNVLWDGPSVKLASGFLTNGREASTGRVELFTPNPFQSGSSVSHFSTAASPSLLMEPSITLGLPLTLDLTRQQMRDVGWYRDTTSDVVADTITSVQPSNPTLSTGTTASVSWTNNGGFNRNVTIELSTDGGVTFPTVLGADVSNFSNLATFNFVVPNTVTNQAVIRVREHDFADPVGVSGVFTILAPTAASVSVRGRLQTPAGRGIAGATVSVIGADGVTRTARSGPFGQFAVGGIEAGRTYTVFARAKGWSIQPQLINVNEEVTGLVLVAN